jgi:hypothetical protein
MGRDSNSSSVIRNDRQAFTKTGKAYANRRPARLLVEQRADLPVPVRLPRRYPDATLFAKRGHYTSVLDLIFEDDPLNVYAARAGRPVRRWRHGV